MNFLEFFFVISGIVILIIGFDIAKKQKFNALHFLVFLGVGVGLLVFTFFPNFLQTIGDIFGVARGADVLVYASIIFLLYFSLLLLTKYVENKEEMTRLIRELAIEQSKKNPIQGNEVFLIRAYNEGSIIGEVIEEILQAGYKYILVIDDGSTDNTQRVLDTFGEQIHRVKHSINRGAGAALETGFEYLRRYGKVKNIITFDADGQHRVDDAKKILYSLEQNPEKMVIFGSRFIGEKKSNIPITRKVTLFLGRIFTFLVSGVFLSDAHNGLRGFRQKIIHGISLEIDSMAYASEFIDKLKKHHYKINEIPVTIKYTEYSLSKGQSSGNAINIAMRILWSKFFK